MWEYFWIMHNLFFILINFNCKVATEKKKSRSDYEYWVLENNILIIVYSLPCLSKTDEPYEKKLLNNAGYPSIKVWMHIFSLTITPPSVVMKLSLSLNVNAMLNVDIQFLQICLNIWLTYLTCLFRNNMSFILVQKWTTPTSCKTTLLNIQTSGSHSSLRLLLKLASVTCVLTLILR